jgi:hypothetical protein
MPNSTTVLRDSGSGSLPPVGTEVRVETGAKQRVYLVFIVDASSPSAEHLAYSAEHYPDHSMAANTVPQLNHRLKRLDWDRVLQVFWYRIVACTSENCGLSTMCVCDKDETSLGLQVLSIIARFGIGLSIVKLS